MRVLFLLPLGVLLPLSLVAGSPGLSDAAVARPTHSDRQAAEGRLHPGRGGLTRILPAKTLLQLEGPGLAELLREGADSPLARALEANPTVRALLDQADPSLAELRRQGSEILGAPLLERLGSVLSRGVVLGLAAEADGLQWTLATRGDDPEQLRDSLARSLSFIAEKSGHPRAFDRPHDSIGGFDVWLVGEELCIARRGDLLVACGGRESLREALGRSTALLETSEPVRSAPVSAAPVLRLRVDLDGWLEHARRKAGSGNAQGLENLREAASAPAVQFLLGPSLALIGRSAELRAGLFVDGEDLRLELQGEGIDAGKYAVTLPGSASDASLVPPAPRLEGEGAELLVYRDLDALFRNRADLYPTSVLPKFAEAISNLSLFLGGMDLSDDVLPGLGPWMRAVVRPVSFDQDLVPAQALPAACLLVELDDAERLGGTLVAAFQSAVSIINIERAQQNDKPLLLGIELVDDVAMSRARFLRPSPGDGVDMEYNLAPACAVVGSTFVLGTHEQLVRRVMRSLAAREHEASTPAPRSERLELRAALLADTLEQNLDAVIMSKVLEEGVTRAAAREELEVALGLLALAGGLRLEVECPAPDRVALSLELDLLAAEESRGRSGARREVSR